MEQPRFLLVPEFTELEWAIKPLLEEWAEVASYDSPGVGSSSFRTANWSGSRPMERRRALIAERGLVEASRRGWEQFIVVSDNPAAASPRGMPPCQAARPDAVQAMAFGHACLSLESEGERAPINAEVRSAMERLVGGDREQFVQHALTQLTGVLRRGLADRYSTGSR